MAALCPLKSEDANNDALDLIRYVTILFDLLFFSSIAPFLPFRSLFSEELGIGVHVTIRIAERRVPLPQLKGLD